MVVWILYGMFFFHPHFVLNLVCFCSSLLLSIFLMLMKVVVVVVVVVVVMTIIIISCVFMVLFPAGARMLAADVFLCLKLLVCMKLRVHALTHARADTGEDPILPLLFKCHSCLLQAFESVLLDSHRPEVSLNVVVVTCHGRLDGMYDLSMQTNLW
jgi:hypothetical protein